MTDQKEDAAVAAFGAAIHDCIMALPEDERFKKSKKTFLDALWDDIQYDIIDRMSESIEWFVRDMAQRTVDAIIAGNEDQMRRYLKLDGYTGRHEPNPTFGPKRDIADAHPVIHGGLFEAGAIALRKSIAQAHADLIRNERIADLEDQVASLTAQVRKKDIELEQMRDRVSQYQ